MLGIYCRISKEKDKGKDRSINDQKLLGIELSKYLKIPYKTNGTVIISLFVPNFLIVLSAIVYNEYVITVEEAITDNI